MKALRVFACYITAIKLLVGVCYTLVAIFYALFVSSQASTGDGLVVLSIFFGAIALAYPFSLVRTKRAVAWLIVGVSAVPFCFTFALLPMAGADAWIKRAIALVLPALCLTELYLAERLEATPGRLSIRTRIVTIAGAMVSIAAAIWGVDFATSRGRPYQLPAMAFEGDSSELRQTVVLPMLDTPIPQGKNAIWCGTLQLAWNHLGQDVLHGPPQVRDAEEVASRLNQSEFAEADLPPDSYLATAGFAKDGVVEKVKSEMEERFHKDVKIEPLEPDGILAYAYLEASAAFTIPFFDNQGSLHFRDSSGKETRVSSFGIEERHEYAYEKLRRQIDVLYLVRRKKNPEEVDEFAVDLCRDSTPNQIVIACVPPKATMQDTLKDVEKKIQDFKTNPDQAFQVFGKEFGIRDVLLVPNLNWELRHRFAELEGTDNRLLNPGFESYHIERAMQTIRFKLDRSGAELASEAQMVCKPMATHFICDRPFLIIVKNRGAEHPFFVMWVDNAELLCKP